MFIVNMLLSALDGSLYFFIPHKSTRWLLLFVCLFVCFGVTRLISFLTRDLMVYQERMENLESSELW